MEAEFHWEPSSCCDSEVPVSGRCLASPVLLEGIVKAFFRVGLRGRVAGLCPKWW